MIDDSDFIFAQSLREKKCFCWCHTNTLGTILRRFPHITVDIIIFTSLPTLFRNTGTGRRTTGMLPSSSSVSSSTWSMLVFNCTPWTCSSMDTSQRTARRSCPSPTETQRREWIPWPRSSRRCPNALSTNMDHLEQSRTLMDSVFCPWTSSTRRSTWCCGSGSSSSSPGPRSSSYSDSSQSSQCKFCSYFYSC